MQEWRGGRRKESRNGRLGKRAGENKKGEGGQMEGN